MKKWINEIGIQIKKGAGGVGDLTNEEADKVIEYCIKKWQEFGMTKIDIATGIALINVESGFNYKAKCPSSTAKGLGQFLNPIWNEAVDNANKLNKWKIDKDKMRMDFETQVIILGKRIQDTLAPRTLKFQTYSSFSGFKYPEILYSIHHDWNEKDSSNLLKGKKIGSEKVYANLKPIFLDTYDKVYNEIIKEGNPVPIKEGNFTPQEKNSTKQENQTSNLKKVNPDNTSSKKSDATVKSNSSGKIVIKDYNPLDFKLQVPEYIRSDGSIKQIDDTSSNSNVKELGLSITNKFVCEGATTSCTLGVSIGKLTSIENKIFKINNKNVITAMDNKVGNIGIFGNCKKTSPPSPCKFVLKENWNKYDSYFGIGGNAFGKITLTNFFITEKSQCKCLNGGIISIIQPQQEFVGNSRGFNKEESTIIKSDEISKSEKTETNFVAKKTEVKKDNTTYEKKESKKAEGKSNTLLEKVKAFMKKQNYEIYTKPYILNIVGIRSKNRVANKFDDKLIVFYTDENSKEILFSKTTPQTGNGQEYFDFTTDPGITYLEKWSSTEKGCAILKKGQYKNNWIIGYHLIKKPDKRYKALVQSGYLYVYRDNNKDSNLNLNEKSLEKRNDTGINIHKPWKDCQEKQTVIKNISAGCQVFANPYEFDSFMKLAYKQQNKGNEKFTYTLLHEEEI
jgi:hypothetical protein